MIKIFQTMFIYIIFLFIFQYVCMQSRNLSNNLPLEEDLENYIDSLKSVSEFYVKYLYQVDVNSLFGLFLINANFKHILDNKKGLSSKTQEDMKYILQTNENTIKTYITTTDEQLPYPYSLIATLFDNVNLWASHLNQFTYTEQERYSKNDLEAKYSDWATYKENRLDGIPNQNISNSCLESLALYPANTKKRIRACPLNETCNEALKTGNDYGYALSHRIMWLVLSRYGRGCNILSSREDKELKEKLCAMAFAETEYHVFNNYESADLMFEFMCVCSLGGHAEFLQRQWLEEMLDFQINSGCFKGDVKEQPFDVSLDRLDTCNHHTTALSACTLSTAVRYIVEK